MAKRKREQESHQWRMLIHLANTALKAVADDPNYPCQCGTEPYLDGEACPPCFAAFARSQLMEAMERIVQDEETTQTNE